MKEEQPFTYEGYKAYLQEQIDARKNIEPNEFKLGKSYNKMLDEEEKNE